MNLNYLLKLIEKDDIATVFVELDALNINSVAFSRLRKEFILGRMDVDFHDRLKTAIRSSQRTVSTVKKATTAKTKILFLAANPTELAMLQSGKEYRSVKAELERGSDRDKFEFLHPEFALTASNLVRTMKQQPNFIHFSGHGDDHGIIVTNEQNKAELLPNRALQRLFTSLKDTTQLVLFNSCYSSTQAEIISKFGIHVIGYDILVSNETSTKFAKGLYNGLGEGKSIQEAFNDAMIVASNLEGQVAVWFNSEQLDW